MGKEQNVEQPINFNTRGAAKRLGLAPQTLANWRHLRKGPPYVRIGGNIIYRRIDLDAYEEENLIYPEGGRN